jgi:hypothetical protein
MELRRPDGHWPALPGSRLSVRPECLSQQLVDPRVLARDRPGPLAH